MDIIQLLPDSVANQIAAGEVIQRPASAVKELLENAVDAGATNIKLVVKDAGRTLVQVIDNGCGMSETDARLSFERHATSKIRKSDDLFSIRTMGFRGEALASIAAVAQVELKTRRIGDELGTIIETEASEVKRQENCHCAEGTSFSMKNLFHNVPARRNFLKTNAVEIKHIIDEFERVALAYPQISFAMHHNGENMFTLKGGNMAHRIVGIYGEAYKPRLVAVNEQTSIIEIKGYVIKPEYSKKTRGEQFFFVNNRFIKDPYLHHAVQGAFEEMLPSGHYPSYFLSITINPQKIDINIHPTKTEIKFEDEKSIYAIMRSAVKRSLGLNNIVPTIDFNQEMSFNIPIRQAHQSAPEKPSITVNTGYNPFNENIERKSSSSAVNYGSSSRNRPSTQKEWGLLYQGLGKEEGEPFLSEQKEENNPELLTVEELIKPSFQLHNKYILSQVKSGVMMIDQQLAHERILYEKYLHALTQHTVATQQQLFSQTIEFNAADFALVKELEEDIRILGFDIQPFGKNTYVIQGMPADIVEGEARLIIEGLLEQYKHNVTDLRIDKRDNLARSMARNTAIKAGKLLSAREMKSIIDELFACQIPYTSPYGKPTVVMMTLEEMAKRFS
jgi:DNA mismatch repair protein MutL